MPEPSFKERPSGPEGPVAGHSGPAAPLGPFRGHCTRRDRRARSSWDLAGHWVRHCLVDALGTRQQHPGCPGHLGAVPRHPCVYPAAGSLGPDNTPARQHCLRPGHPGRRTPDAGPLFFFPRPRARSPADFCLCHYALRARRPSVARTASDRDLLLSLVTLRCSWAAALWPATPAHPGSPSGPFDRHGDLRAVALVTRLGVPADRWGPAMRPARPDPPAHA